MKITLTFILGLALGYWLRRFRKPWVCPCGWQDCDGFHCAAKPPAVKLGVPTPAALQARLDAARSEMLNVADRAISADNAAMQAKLDEVRATLLAAVDGGRMPERRRNPGGFGK